MKKEEKVFRSRISILLMGFMLAVFIPICIPIFQQKLYPVLFILGVVFFPMILIFTGMRYSILGSKLYYKMWNLPSGNIDIMDILSVERSYNPLSSPAASLKRLRISLKKTAKYPYSLVSPVREQEFIEALKVVNPNIYVRIPEKKGIWRFWDWDV